MLGSIGDTTARAVMSIGAMAEWSIAAVLKTVEVRAYGGGAKPSLREGRLFSGIAGEPLVEIGSVVTWRSHDAFVSRVSGRDGQLGYEKG